MKNKVLIVLISLMILAIGLILVTKLYRKSEENKVALSLENNLSTLVPPYAPQLGPENAPVTVVEFLDPECESCREFYPTVKMIMEEFPGKIKLVIRYAPFHGNSILIIKVLEAARKQNRYWETLETLFRYQPDWGNHHHPRPELIWHFLKQVDLDLDRVQVDMKDPNIDAMITKEIDDGKELNVRATPTFFVNGKMVTEFGYVPLKAAIEAVLNQ